MKNVSPIIVRRVLLIIGVCFAIVQNIRAQNFVVGYMPTYNNFPNAVYGFDLDVLTHINIAFVNPDGNGNIYMPNGTSTVVNAAHAKGVKVQISICGGAGSATDYHNILSNSNTTNYFIANLVKACVDNNLDGVDVDIEGNVLDGNYVTAAQYENFVTKLGIALHAQNKLMTSALAGWFIDRVTNTAAQSFDLLGLMSYDAFGGWTGPGQHSPYSMAVNDFNQWKNDKGVDPKKILIGLPFYGYGWGNNQRAWPYADVVNAFSGAENLDQIGTGADVFYYNGIPTIKQKTTFAKANSAGVMIWELTQDIAGAKSLLKAVGEVMGTKNSDLVPDNLAKGKTCTSSSNEVGNNVLANATDGLYSTRWSSLFTDNEWLYVNLADTYNVSQVKITWETASAKNYSVQFSEDAINWSTIKTISNNTILTNDHSGLNGKAKFVRINCSARNTVYGYSIYELEVYGTALPKPYSGTAATIPGIIQAENYDLGGEGIGYHDMGATNTHGQYRADGVDIEACSDAGTGFNIGDTQAGEWLVYSVNVSTAGLYELNVRVAATAAGKNMSIEMDDVNVSGTISIPNTNGWQTWQTVTIKNISLTAGLKTMKVVMGSDLINLNNISFVKPTITNIDNELVNSTNIYPNPTAESLHYSLSNLMLNDNKIEFINTDGDVVLELNNVEINGIINLENLSAGIYVCRISNANMLIVKRLVIVK
jgi:GH18 family chitinase